MSDIERKAKGMSWDRSWIPEKPIYLHSLKSGYSEKIGKSGVHGTMLSDTTLTLICTSLKFQSQANPVETKATQ